MLKNSLLPDESRRRYGTGLKYRHTDPRAVLGFLDCVEGGPQLVVETPAMS
jgi:hypothetical protein